MDQLLATARYVLAVIMLLTVPPAFVYWFIIHPLIDFWRRLGPTRTYCAMVLFGVLSVAALYPFRDRLLGSEWAIDRRLLIAGVVFLAVAGVVQWLRSRHLDWKSIAGLPELAPETHPGPLLQEGIYSRIRHPRYVEVILALIGWSLVLQYPGLVVMTALTTAMIYPIVVLEERELVERYGEAYVAYARRVPRFIPRWR